MAMKLVRQARLELSGGSTDLLRPLSLVRPCQQSPPKAQTWNTECGPRPALPDSSGRVTRAVKP